MMADKENEIPISNKDMKTNRRQLFHDAMASDNIEEIFILDEVKLRKVTPEIRTKQLIRHLEDDTKDAVIAPLRCLQIWLSLASFVEKRSPSNCARKVYEKISEIRSLRYYKDLYKMWCSFELRTDAVREAKLVLELAVRNKVLTEDERKEFFSNAMKDLKTEEATIALSGNISSKESVDPTISFTKRHVLPKSSARVRGKLGGLGSKFGPAKRLIVDESSKVEEPTKVDPDDDTLGTAVTKPLGDLSYIKTWTPDDRRASVSSVASDPSTELKDPTISFKQQSKRNVIQPKESTNDRVSAFQTSMFSSKNVFVVNGRVYLRLALIGRGGTSKVYKVLAIDDKNEGETYALKKIKLSKTDISSLSCYQNEISLLERLRGNPSIIQLVDSEVNLDEKVIYMVMEHGEVDLNVKLQSQRGGSNTSSGAPSGLCYNFIRLTWMNMLEALHSIHEERIVHGDLKPANFLFVKGKLKLIDFGIAKAISNDTTNIMRDSQVGTLNYMSPESINDTNHSAGAKPTIGLPGMKFKQGRASDIWSMGCILYQMVYGKTPFADLNPWKKIQTISDPNHSIEFPPLANPTDIMDVLVRCLKYNPAHRPPIISSLNQVGLLSHSFLTPGEGNNSSSTFGPCIEESSLEEQIETLLENALEGDLASAIKAINARMPDKLKQFLDIVSTAKAIPDAKKVLGPKIVHSSAPAVSNQIPTSLQESIRSGRAGLKALGKSNSSKYMASETKEKDLVSTLRDEFDKRRTLIDSKDQTLDAMLSSGHTWDGENFPR